MKRVPAYEINCRNCTYEGTIIDSIEARAGNWRRITGAIAPSASGGRG